MANEFKHKVVGGELSKDEWEDTDTHEADSQAAGDLLYCDGTYWKRLPKGTDGHLLQSGSTPSWGALEESDIPAAIARDSEVTDDIATHAALESAHHTKFTITEHDTPDRHGLANLDPDVCSEAEADSKISTHAADDDAHHAKYTDAEAQATVKANVGPEELKAPAAALAMNSQKITGLAAPASAGDALRKGTALTITEMPANMKYAAISFIIDGGGSAITTGQKGHLEIPFACTINQVTVLADQSGSIVVDIWKDAYANFPPADADSITASAPPTLSSAQKSQDSTLTGWTTSISAGDILAFNVDSVSTVERVLISLKVTRT